VAKQRRRESDHSLSSASVGPTEIIESVFHLLLTFEVKIKLKTKNTLFGNLQRFEVYSMWHMLIPLRLSEAKIFSVKPAKLLS